MKVTGTSDTQNRALARKGATAHDEFPNGVRSGEGHTDNYMARCGLPPF